MWPSPPSTGQLAFYMNQICSPCVGRLTVCAFPWTCLFSSEASTVIFQVMCIVSDNAVDSASHQRSDHINPPISPKQSTD